MATHTGKKRTDFLCVLATRSQPRVGALRAALLEPWRRRAGADGARTLVDGLHRAPRQRGVAQPLLHGLEVARSNRPEEHGNESG